MELWDAYDRNLEKIEGMTLIRGEKIPEGVYHLVCDVIVRHTDGEYLLMQRDSRKHCGGMWEATAGGSALQGENPLDCAIRELREETGIHAEHLEEVGRVRAAGRNAIYCEFLCITDCRKDSIILQEGETSAYKWVTQDELLSMKRDELVTQRMQNFVDDLKSGRRRMECAGGLRRKLLLGSGQNAGRGNETESFHRLGASNSRRGSWTHRRILHGFRNRLHSGCALYALHRHAVRGGGIPGKAAEPEDDR